ncbi:MAG: nucleotidyltransferase domain-containing protein [Chloroflexi bacterium]|nr:nucleotidyltransferase domain-containing protein [Chloroflexota bacterium]
MVGTVQSSSPNLPSRVPLSAIYEIAQVIAEKFQPDKVVLFGSYAYGEPKPWSDVDFLVVMDTPQGEARALRAVRDALPRRPFSVDVVVRSQAEIDRRIALDDWFLDDITRKGRVLYARTDR